MESQETQEPEINLENVLHETVMQLRHIAGNLFTVVNMAPCLCDDDEYTLPCPRCIAIQQYIRWVGDIETVRLIHPIVETEDMVSASYFPQVAWSASNGEVAR